MATDITWIYKLKKNGRPPLAIEKARAILVMLQKRVDEQNVLPKAAYADVAGELGIGKQTVTQLFSECRKALGNDEYNTLEAYWEDGRPYAYKQSVNKKKVKAGKQ